MKINLTDEELLATPVASGGGVFFCPDPDCYLPHIILVDGEGRPMAHYIVGLEFYADLQRAMQQKTGIEIEWPEQRFMSYVEIEHWYLDAVANHQIIASGIDKINDPSAMALALENIGKIRLATKLNP